MKVQPYLFFEGRCEEALEFYGQAIGAKIGMVMRFKDSPEPPQDGCAGPAMGPDKIMHASFQLGESTLLVSDGMCSGTPDFKGTALTIEAATEAEAEKLFAALGEGGQVLQPLQKTFFSPKFGMLHDRFGLMWMVLVDETK